MLNIEKEPKTIFFENLAAITGTGAMVKLDMTDDQALEKYQKNVS